jgi:serine phosphatase RsbU (regulator of sigma subunit)/anti-sigma regulatory factor (Ser/Thr protein kinase)/TolA-binding protein
LFRQVAKEELRVPGKVEYLGELRDFVTRVGKKYGFSERIINAFKLSIDEAATNIIKHAYRDWEGDITLRAVAKNNSLTIVLVDQGKYFDPREVASPDLQRYVDIGKKGGLGIFIMRRLLDNIEYRKTEEGNELWMVKNRDEVKKRKISFSTIPLSLKMRYWLYSLIIFTSILLAVSYVNFSNARRLILNGYIEKGLTACSSLQANVTSRWSAIDPDVIRFLKDYGSDDIEVRAGADIGINSLASSHKSILKELIIADKRGVILASSDSSRTVWEETFKVSESARTLRVYDHSVVFLMNDESGKRILNIAWAIEDNNEEQLAEAHFQINYSLVNKDVYQGLRTLLGEAAIIWLIVSAGLFFLIYLVMNPFKRLQEWVKHMSEPGSADDMDIDSTTEIGAIAQAFSDMTNQLRRSQQNLAEQERLQQEMHIAKQIQQTLLPKEFPEVEGYDISSYYAAAKEVGGDYFDFVEVDSDTIGIAVADVSGKGVPGAFVMTMIRTALRSEARGVKDAAEVLAKVNDFVVGDMKRGMFVTLFYVIIDSKRRRLNFASAGHNPMILHRPSRNKTYYLNPRGFPIGISLPDKNLFRESIKSDTIALAEDDIVLVYTDGVTEAMNRKRRLFGEERYLKLIRESGKKSAEEFVDILKKEMNIFTEGSEQNDDITLVAVKERTSAEKIEFERAARAYTSVQNGTGIREACKEAGISTYSYYHKFKEKFDLDGVDGYIAPVINDDQIDAKHLSIEEKNKIYDVIRRHPEYGAKRMQEELNSERYEFSVIPVSKIYDELVRMRLNTKELREAFVQRGGRKQRIKPPGTPMMTIDGKLIMNRTQYEEPVDDDLEDKIEPVAIEPVKIKEPELPKQPTVEPIDEQEIIESNEPVQNVYAIDKEKLLTAPLEDILDKRSSAVDGESKGDETTSDYDKVDEDSHQENLDIDSKDSSVDEIGDEPEDNSKVVEEEIEYEDEVYEGFDDIFGYVEDAALSDGPEEVEEPIEKTPVPDYAQSSEPEELTESAGNFTIVSEEEILEYTDDGFEEEDELTKIEDNFEDDLGLESENDLELLSGLGDNNNGDHDEFGFSFNYVEDNSDDDVEPIDAPVNDDNSSTDVEQKNDEFNDPAISRSSESNIVEETGSNDSVEESKEEVVEKDVVENSIDQDVEDKFLAFDDDVPDVLPGPTLSVDNYEEEFKELLPLDDNPFDYWISEDNSQENIVEDKSEQIQEKVEETKFSDSSENLDDPFEEFLEIQDEHGLITPEGELDYEIVDQLLKSDDDSTDNNGHDSFGNDLVNQIPKSIDEVQKREEEDDDISLDELVTISNDEEPLFARQDEEFDSLLKDAVSNDEKIQQLLNDNQKSRNSLNEVHNSVESVLQRASDLYHESRYDDAAKILQDVSEKHPADFRAHSMLGNAYFREKRYKDAVMQYERVIDLDPLNEKACENLAIAYANLGQLVRAIHQWERLLRMTPNRSDIQKSIQKAKAFLNKS